MKRLQICILVILLFGSFKKDNILTSQFSVDFNGNQHIFTGLKYIHFNSNENSTIFGAVIDSTLSPEYGIELKTFKKIPGTYPFGIYASAYLIHKTKINNIDTIISYYSTNGNLNITFFDTINHIIQGSFSCLAKDFYSGDTVNIHNGNFTIY